MASALVRYPAIPQCLSCLRRFAGPEILFSASPTRIQVRGKKKKARLPATVNVRLLSNTLGYGRKGSIVPVAPGRMRNIWYPAGLAEYVTKAQLKMMKDVVVERDFAFGVRQPMVEGPAQELAKVVAEEARIRLLSPQRTTQLISALIPECVYFYRPRISTTEPEHPQASVPKQTAMSPAISTLSTASQPASTQAATAIYGSVTAADILSSIMALLNMKATGEYEDAARVVLAPEDIHIIQAEATDFSEIGKIKALGEYEIHILVRGEEPIRRKIRVEAQK